MHHQAASIGFGRCLNDKILLRCLQSCLCPHLPQNQLLPSYGTLVLTPRHKCHVQITERKGLTVVAVRSGCDRSYLLWSTVCVHVMSSTSHIPQNGLFDCCSAFGCTLWPPLPLPQEERFLLLTCMLHPSLSLFLRSAVAFLCKQYRVARYGPGPTASSQARNRPPFGLPLGSGCAPLEGRVIDLGLRFGGQTKLEFWEIRKEKIDKDCMLFEAWLTQELVPYPRTSACRKNMKLIRTAPLVFTLCFVPFAARSKNKNLGCVHFGQARVLSVSMKCRTRANDVFCAVSLSGTMWSAKWPNVARHHLVLRGKPLQPPLRDCGRPSAVAIFLLSIPWDVIFSMSESSFAERTIMRAKCSQHECGVWCVAVRRRSLKFCHKFQRSTLHQKYGFDIPSPYGSS